MLVSNFDQASFEAMLRNQAAAPGYNQQAVNQSDAEFIKKQFQFKKSST